MKASVIVPIFYSEPGLDGTLARLAALREELDLEILLVVDVPDRSREADVRSTIDAVVAGTGAIVIYRVGERGFGSALRRGFAEATGDVLIPFMGDASDEASDIPKLVADISRGSDLAVGSRYIPGGGIVGDTPKQRLSRLYSTLARVIGDMPVHDVSNAFKAYRRSVIESVPSTASSFDVSAELTIKAHRQGFRLTEIPTVWTNRIEGRSNFRFSSELTGYLRWLMCAAGARFAPGSWRRRGNP